MNTPFNFKIGSNVLASTINIQSGIHTREKNFSYKLFLDIIKI